MLDATSGVVSVTGAEIAEEAALPLYVRVWPCASVVRKTSWPFSEVVPSPEASTEEPPVTLETAPEETTLGPDVCGAEEPA